MNASNSALRDDHARRVVGTADDDDAGPLGDGVRHGIEIMPAIRPVRHGHAGRARHRDDPGIRLERAPGVDHLVARLARRPARAGAGSTPIPRRRGPRRRSPRTARPAARAARWPRRPDTVRNRDSPIAARIDGRVGNGFSFDDSLNASLGGRASLPVRRERRDLGADAHGHGVSLERGGRAR